VLDGGRRLNEALKVLPPRAERETRYVLRTIDETFHGYVRGMLLISLIYGVGTASIMIGMDLPAALPVAIISSLLLAVPFLGDWLALILPTVVAYTAGGFLTMVIVLGTLLFIQQVMLNLLTPRILGHAVRMPAMLVIIAVVIGARLAGISGALLGVPTVGVLYRIATHYGMIIRERREARESVERDAKTSAVGPSADEASTDPESESEVDSDREPAPIAGGAPENEESEQPKR
jgi:predicted PurR-regulated permease PerM